LSSRIPLNDGCRTRARLKRRSGGTLGGNSPAPRVKTRVNSRVYICISGGLLTVDQVMQHPKFFGLRKDTRRLGRCSARRRNSRDQIRLQRVNRWAHSTGRPHRTVRRREGSLRGGPVFLSLHFAASGGQDVEF
jgi:hypothetical protein